MKRGTTFGGGSVKSALFWMLEQVLGGDFTEETKQAWTEIYGLLSEAMIGLPSGPGALSA